MTALERAVGAIAQFLEARGIPYMVIGGIANLIWGHARATFDVDVSVLVEEQAWQELIAGLRSAFRVIPQDPIRFLRDTHVAPVEAPEGIRINLVWARLPYEQKAIARAISEEIGGYRVRVCRPEDLIIHKILSDRPKDREDVRGIVRQQAARLDRPYLFQVVRELGGALGRQDLKGFLDACFRDRTSELSMGKRTRRGTSGAQRRPHSPR